MNQKEGSVTVVWFSALAALEEPPGGLFITILAPRFNCSGGRAQASVLSKVPSSGLICLDTVALRDSVPKAGAPRQELEEPSARWAWEGFMEEVDWEDSQRGSSQSMRGNKLRRGLERGLPKKLPQPLAHGPCHCCNHRRQVE